MKCRRGWSNHSLPALTLDALIFRQIHAEILMFTGRSCHSACCKKILRKPPVNPTKTRSGCAPLSAMEICSYPLRKTTCHFPSYVHHFFPFTRVCPQKKLFPSRVCAKKHLTFLFSGHSIGWSTRKTLPKSRPVTRS